MGLDAYRAWLRHRLASNNLSSAYIFGSALYSFAPRDVDLVVVTLAGAGSVEWFEARRGVKNAASQFLSHFGKPLSIVVATPAEWLELDGTVVMARMPVFSSSQN